MALEDKKTRRQGDKTILMLAESVGSKTNVSYSCIPVFLYSKPSRLLVFSSSCILKTKQHQQKTIKLCTKQKDF